MDVKVINIMMEQLDILDIQLDYFRNLYSTFKNVEYLEKILSLVVEKKRLEKELEEIEKEIYG